MRTLANDPNIQRRSRWYFGGISAAMAVCFTHPLELLKVQLQVQVKRKGIWQTVSHLYTTAGVRGFYSGISAGVTRQLTYTMTRFGIYEAGKAYVNTDTFAGKASLAGTAGFVASAVGIPTDKVNVRMQNDSRMPPEKRFNYKHVFDALIRIRREEGFRQLFSGGSFATAKGVLMTIGQNAVYDQVKSNLLATPYFNDNIACHFTSSFVAGGITTLMTSPLDVLKTRSMNAKPGQFESIWHIFQHTAKSGPMAFFKGAIPAYMRVGPQTILIFVFMEQLRIHFGVLPRIEETKRESSDH